MSRKIVFGPICICVWCRSSRTESRLKGREQCQRCRYCYHRPANHIYNATGSKMKVSVFSWLRALQQQKFSILIRHVTSCSKSENSLSGLIVNEWTWQVRTVKNVTINDISQTPLLNQSISCHLIAVAMAMRVVKNTYSRSQPEFKDQRFQRSVTGQPRSTNKSTKQPRLKACIHYQGL